MTTLSARRCSRGTPYRHDEILWNRRFTPAFYVDDEGDLVLELKKVGEIAGA